MTAKSTREGPSGCVRPCSQFLTVAALNPNRAANWDWLRPSFWRRDGTSITGARLTCTTVTLTGTFSPLVQASAWLSASMSLRPAAVCLGAARFLADTLVCLRIVGLPPIVLCYDLRNNTSHRILICFGEV
jgi:hypothetical protein